MKKEIKKILDRFDFVRWDRAIPSGIAGEFVDIYGWIQWKVFACFTSSAIYSKKVNELSGFSEQEHTNCIPIEEYLSSIS